MSAAWKGEPMRRGSRTIAYYITPHGFGHAVRSLEVIRHLLENSRDDRVIIVSDIPEFLIIENAGGQVPLRRRRLDVGLVQQDSLRFDVNATQAAVEALYHGREQLIEEEVEFLQGVGVTTVVSDVAFLPFFAASRLGIPSIGVGNFTWDWIYGEYALSDNRWEPLIAWIRQGYRHCGLFLQLPMHGDCSVFPHMQDVPLITRKARRDPREVRKYLELNEGTSVYLIAFAHLDLSERAIDRIASIKGALFLFKYPLRYSIPNSLCLDGLDLTYPDVVAAVDGVITKPGYGIVADCLAHGTPMIYTERGEFPEYPILVEAMEKYLPTVYIPSQDLCAGRWEAAVNRLKCFPHCIPSLRTDGAAVCAEMILTSC